MKMFIKIISGLVAIFIAYLVIPQTVHNPVEGCGEESYNHKTFWHPWGDHYHRGVDIFAKKGTPIHPATCGIVISVKENQRLGGKCVLIMGTHGRLYYYAHMDEIKTHKGAFVDTDDVIGTVGNTGNAANTPSHCHFSISTIIPQLDHWPKEDEDFWKMGNWQKIFFIDPVDVISDSKTNEK
ncbi:MAG: M23 family metallopeptidase [Bacteroidales bacterium]|nr:M23 family metallopeptidase [Bacteroidales bacterium]